MQTDPFRRRNYTSPRPDHDRLIHVAKRPLPDTNGFVNEERMTGEKTGPPRRPFVRAGGSSVRRRGDNYPQGSGGFGRYPQGLGGSATGRPSAAAARSR